MAIKGETLSESELSRLKPIRGEGGKTWRAFCPFHGSDKQRSLRVDRRSGRFQCFACDAWGYMDWAREEFRAVHAANGKTQPNVRGPLPRPASFAHPLGSQAANIHSQSIQPSGSPVPPVLGLPLSHSTSTSTRPSGSATSHSEFPSHSLQPQAAAYQAALPGSLGEEYLAERKIPLALAQRLGVGYSAPGSWAHTGESGRPIRDWNFGRLVFPHTATGGELVNLYGRAIGDRVPKSLRHDHLPGHKGYFNFPALERAVSTSEDLYVCEGPFDALSILAAQPDANVIAIFGVQGWRHDWSAKVKRFVFALDADSAGQRAWRSLARQLVLRGKHVRILPSEAFGGTKDANEAWVQGILDLG